MATATVFQVFTPTTQAKRNFVERGAINDRLVDALRTPGKQLIVYGETGSGKSTLLVNKLHQLYEGHITTSCTEKTTFDGLLLAAFDQVAPFFTSVLQHSENRGRMVSLGSAFKGIQAAVEASRQSGETATTERAVPVQLTAERLGQFLGEVGQCWLIEDFHKVPPEQKRYLAQSLKVFCDQAQDYANVKVIAVGATNTAREVVQYDREMANRVAEVEVPLMTDEEVGLILDNGGAILNVRFGTTRDLLVLYSMGVASICHQLALNMCLAHGVLEPADEAVEFTSMDVMNAMQTYIRDSSDTLKAKFDEALRRYQVKKFDNARLILSALASLPPAGALSSEILAEIKKVRSDYPSGNLTTYLKRLQRTSGGGIIRQEDDGRFAFVDAFHHLYAHWYLNRAERKGLSDEALTNEMVKEAVATLDALVERLASSGFRSPRGGSRSVQLPLWNSQVDVWGDIHE